METTEIVRIIGVCVGSYLLGSIPFGHIVSKYAHKKRIDIRKVGSGNIGGTNVGRTLGFKYGALVAGLDGWKGALPVILTMYFLWHSWWFAGLSWLFAFSGHLFPVWLKFKGGKGISVFVGGLLALLGWQACLIIFGCWTIVFIFFVRRKMSAANLLITGGILLFILALPVLLYVAPILLIIIGLIWWAHRENIKRIADNKEPSIKLPVFFEKLPDDVIGLAVEKLQLLIARLQKYQKKP